ncbi:hypothetical protein BSFA1_82780 (plasmid) [Burkholderia sp. SFA1]|nr:hypothetical protein BYI23_E002930 [Burkholderia sp. YI23]BBQ03150.1 hypothetical protein BSFA1_82780 [Burkholderia sp. SFA1]
MLKKLAFLVAASTLSMAAVAASTTVIKSPFSGIVPDSSVLPAVKQINGIDGVKAGDARSASAGKVLVDVTVSTKTTTAFVEVVREVSLTTGDATLTLRPGARIAPAARLVDPNGKLFYLVKTDRNTSSFFKTNRFFAVTEEGAVLDHAFSATGDTYEARETVSVTPGDMVVTTKLTTGPALCGLTAVYLGGSEGVAKFRVLRTSSNGRVTAEHERAFASDLKFINLSGTDLTIDKIDADAVRVKVRGLDQPSCTGTI